MMIPTKSPRNRYEEIPVEAILPNRVQPRRAMDEEKLAELTTSVAGEGVIEPIVVEPMPDGRYMLHVGERRVRAARRAALPFVPAIVVEPMDDEELLIRALSENLQREDMNPIDTGLALARLKEMTGANNVELGRKVGLNSETVGIYLGWLAFEPEIQEVVAQSLLPRSRDVQRALASIEDSQTRVKLAQKLARKGQRVAAVVEAAKVYNAQFVTLGEKTAGQRKGLPKARMRTRNGRRAHALALVDETGGRLAPEIEKAATATCHSCPLFEGAIGLPCRECPLVTFLLAYCEVTNG